MAQVVAERPVGSLIASGFVIMRKPIEHPSRNWRDLGPPDNMK